MKKFKTKLNINIDLAACIKAIGWLLLVYYFVFEILTEHSKKFLLEFISIILKQTK